MPADLCTRGCWRLRRIRSLAKDAGAVHPLFAPAGDGTRGTRSGNLLDCARSIGE